MGRVVGVLVGQSWEEGMALGKETEVAVGDREAVGLEGSIACCVLKQRDVGRVKEMVGGWQCGGEGPCEVGGPNAEGGGEGAGSGGKRGGG